jgi:hypothetical protein
MSSYGTSAPQQLIMVFIAYNRYEEKVDGRFLVNLPTGILPINLL